MRASTFALCAAAAIALFSAPALAVPVYQAELTISFMPEPPPIIPQNALMQGLASFFADINGNFMPEPPPIDIGSQQRGSSFHTVFTPGEPCFGDGSCHLGFSFTGTTGIFGTFAYLNADGPLIFGPSPPPIDIGALNVLSPEGPPIDVLGILVAFDAPIQVGTWEVRVSAVPEPSSVVLLLSALGGLVALRRRKTRA